jgi:hypothetical protein
MSFEFSTTRDHGSPASLFFSEILEKFPVPELETSFARLHPPPLQLTNNQAEFIGTYFAALHSAAGKVPSRIQNSTLID